jgi:hypothetical protein
VAPGSLLLRGHVDESRACEFHLSTRPPRPPVSHWGTQPMLSALISKNE